MKLSKNIRYLVRVRDYETVHVEVGAEADHHDLGMDDRAWAELTVQQRNTYTLSLELLIIEEVERLARDELARIARWSDIPNNLAEDFLSSTPLPRSSNVRPTANKKADPPPPSRGRGGSGPGPSPSAA